MDLANTMEEFLNLETRLQEQPEFKKRLTHHLSLIGGANPALRPVMSGSTLVCTGKGEKIPFTTRQCTLSLNGLSWYAMLGQVRNLLKT
ncbi:hypothetical protein DPEC_G00192780 [Dallia pectoralis]|uniref:Uncharacterized protein n=1 Tax=Dallia pectoralis TaxID=75939 RepID=A0ACC2GC57_DALPE|nr:hypothetical protein DPEC_G00192780 [Dallia pectoralis]